MPISDECVVGWGVVIEPLYLWEYRASSEGNLLCNNKLLLSATDSAAVVKATAGYLDGIVKRMDELQKAVDNATSLFNQFPSVSNAEMIGKAASALTAYKDETSTFKDLLTQTEWEGGVNMTYKEFGLFPYMRIAFVNWQPHSAPFRESPHWRKIILASS